MDSQTHTKTLHHADIMLEHMPVGVALYDAQDLRLLAANALMLTFLDTHLDSSWQGRTVGHPITDWLPETVAPSLVTICRTVAATGTPFHIDEYLFLSPEHGMTYWKWDLVPVRDSDGHVIQLLQTITEVTTQVLARQQAEQAQASLSQTNRKVENERKRLEVIETVARSVRESLDMESVARAATDAICANFNALGACIHIADPARQELHLLPLLASPSVEQALKLVHHVPYDSPFLIAQARNRRDPIVIEDLQTAVASGTIASNHPFTSQTFPLSVRGYICVPLWFKDHFEGTLTALFKESIQVDGPEVQTLVGSGMHIAAGLVHARLHTDLENERARLRTALDQLPEGILMVEALNGVISYANIAAARILGVPLASLVSAPLNQYPRPSPVKNLNRRPLLPWNFAVIRALSGEAVSSQEMIVTRPEGSKVIILSSTVPFHGQNGSITGAAIVFHDITTRKSIEQQKNEFVSIASHELRTPITAIQGYAEILQMIVSRGQSLGNSYSLRAVTGISEQSECLTRLIEEMLDISRIEHAQLLLDVAPHDLLGMLVHVVESQSVTARQHKLQLVLDGLQPTDTLMGYFDEARIEQVVSNLISNAIKYSPAGGEIEIGLRPILNTAGKPHEALIWVQDPGIGIAVNELPHIFERFHRAGNLYRSISGLGIGLYLAKELVERHGGRIWVESTEGKGSTFYVTLPLDKWGDLARTRKRNNP